MKKLLEGKLPVPTGTLTSNKVARSDLAMSNLTRDIVEYLRWKRTDVTAVAADHWLVSYLIIATSKIGFHDHDPKESFTRTDFLTEELSRAFGFTTEYNAGRLHIGDNGAVTVYIVGKSPRRNQIVASTPYWKMTPLRYISHQSTNLSMGSMAEPEELVGSGFDVIEIDLAILHYQALSFLRFWEKQNPETPRSLQMLVSMDILPRLKLSQYDIAIMNRMTSMANSGPVNNEVIRLSKSFPDRHGEVSGALTSLVKVLLGRELSFEQAIAAIECPLGNSSFITLSMDDYAYTRQVNWAVLLGRVNLLQYLFAICRIEPLRSKRWPVNDIKRTIVRINNDGGFNQTLGLSMRKDIKEKLQDFIDRIG